MLSAGSHANSHRYRIDNGLLQTRPPTPEQREDVGAMLRARLAQLEVLPD